MNLRVLKVMVNYVTLGIDFEDPFGVRIHRGRRLSGSFEEVGKTDFKIYVDSVGLEPGKTYYYYAVPFKGPLFQSDGKELERTPSISVKIPRASKEKRVIVTKKHHEFTVTMGGYLDESNSVTIGPEVYCPGPNSSMPPYDQVFEPNLYLTIENVGESDVVNPWIIANEQRNWWSIETMAQEIIGGRALTETEKMIAVWMFLVAGIYDSRCGLSWFDDLSDPVKLFNVYGFEGCIGCAVAASRLAEEIGLKAREVWVGGILDGHGRGRSCSHSIFEAYTDGSWHLLDTDQMLFFLKRDNNTIASVKDLIEDVDLIRRTHRNLGLAGKDLSNEEYDDRKFSNLNFLSLFQEKKFVYPINRSGAWVNSEGQLVQGIGERPTPHDMSFKLRPAEKLVRYWSNVGKTVVRGRRLHPDVRFSNGKLIYRPNLHLPISLNGIESKSNVKQEESCSQIALHPEKSKEVSEMVWRVKSPYAIAGARMGLTCQRKTQEDGIEVLFSKDGQNWRSVWIATENKVNACVILDWYVNPALNDWREEEDLGWRMGPCYQYYIKIAMWAGSYPKAVGLDNIWLDTDIQCATSSLPSLFCGENKIIYKDETVGSRKVRIIYGWEEEHSVRPPGTPQLVFPKPGMDVNLVDFEFHWLPPKEPGQNVDDYHIQVSRYADCRWCVCPTFDRYVGRTTWAGKTQWKPQFPNLLNSNETYYWRVRARNEKGVWGNWSQSSAFVPHGPRIPLDLRIEGTSLIWKPNPKGNAPTSYLVYGSTYLGGFPVGKDCLLGSVEESCWSLKGPLSRTRMSYRVVAVDTNGVISTPSDFVSG